MKSYIFKFTLSIAVILILISCENEEKQTPNTTKNEEEEALPQQFEFSYEGQNFQVFSLFDGVLDYTNNVLNDEDADKEKVYFDSVEKPFM